MLSIKTISFPGFSCKILLGLCVSIFCFHHVFAQIKYRETANELIVRAGNSTLVLDKKEWHVSLKNETGSVVFEEAAAPAFLIDNKWIAVSSINNIKKLNEYTIRLQLKLSDNKNGIARVQVVNRNAFRIYLEPAYGKVSAIKLANKLKPEEEVYGLGEMWNGSVAQRGNAVEIWDKNGTPDECAYIPYYVTTSNYAYFLDYGGRVNVDAGKTNTDRITLEAPASSISILITSGNSIAQTVSNYLKVTGLPMMPPRWSFQPWWWLMSAVDQPKADISTLNAKEVLAAAKKFKDMDIPAGVTWLEPPWQTARTSLDPSDKFAPDFKNFVDELHKLDLKVLCWTIPYTLPNSSNWDAVVKNNYLVKKPSGQLPEVQITASGEMIAGGYHYIDFTNPAARKFWQGQISKVLKFGIDGFKLDAGQDLPEDAILYAGMGKDLHNSYGRYYNQTFFEILNSTLKGNFLTIPRASWSGGNKYHSFKWPGDLSTSFKNNGLPSSVYSSISAGFSGFSSISTDIGGFSPRPSPEDVWVRWAQFGAMLPGMQTPNMPWWYSKKASDYYRYLSWLHTDMVPFWMSLANEAHVSGVPIVRHLVWTFQDDEKARRIDDEYTLGESILVAPVISAENSRKVYLPKGNWFNFWTDEKTTGGKEISWRGDLYHFPMYVREGAIIPMEVKNSVSGFGTEKSAGYVTVSVWPKSTGECSFILHDTEKPVTITVKQSAGKQLDIKWSASKKKYIFRLNIDDKKRPKKITSAANMLTSFSTLPVFNTSNKDGWYYDESNQKLWIKTRSAAQNSIKIYSFYPPAANFQISKNGKAAVNIVIADNANKEIVFAASELRDYIKKISGAELKIIKEKASTGKNIYVGKSKEVDGLKVSAEGLEKEGFTIQTVKGNLILLGHDDAGTQFAVYTFLENYLGVRWLWPGKLGEVVPAKKSITIGEINEIQQPHYKWRSRMSLKENDVWKSKVTSDATVAEIELWEKRNKWGGIKIYGGHSLSEIFPPEKYAKSHPEYYALANGVRDAPGPNYDYKHGSQVCTTNPDVIRIACEWANKFFDDHPDYDAVNMSMNDGGGLGYCQCERCTTLDDGRKIEAPLDSDESISKDPSKNVIITDRIFTYINQIAESVQKKHPGKYIMCFAYSQYKRPPKNIVINPMVIPQYTQWSAYSHANVKIKSQHERIAKGWGAAADRMAIYEYYINGSWPSLHRIVPGLFADNIKELYKDGVNLYYTQAGSEFAVNGINYYVAGKMLWNTSLDEQKVLQDYYDKGFGKSGKYIQSFNKRMEEAWKTATKDGKDVTAGTLADTRILDLYTPELLQACAEDLDKAAAIAETDPYKKRVAFIQNGFQYTLLTVHATQKAKELLAMGVPLFTKEKAKQEVELTANDGQAKKIKQDQEKLIREALKAWEERDAFVEEHKSDHVVSYFWIKYNDTNRYFNPHQKLKALAEEIK